MSYRQNDLGLLVRIDPKQAKAKIEEAFKQTDDDGEPGRAVVKAAKALDVGTSTLKRWLDDLADKGFPVKRRRKSPGRPPAAPQPVGHRPRRSPKRARA